MTSEQQVARNGWQTISRFFQRVNAIIASIAQPSLTQLVMRFGLATPFWRSGINKWDGFLQLNDTAFLVGSGEILFPILLVLGLATRLAACVLLVMTLVVELTVPDGWPVHVTWAAMALGIMAWGPGRLSLDHWIERRNG